ATDRAHTAARQPSPRPGRGWLARRPAAAAALLANARFPPGGDRSRPATDRAHTAARQPSPRPGLGWLARRPALPLYTTAFSYGLVGAVYWAFAAEAVSDHAGTSSAATAPLFWTLIGLAGTLGVLTGPAIDRFGLRRVHRGLFAGLAAAAALLTATHVSGISLPAALLSALLYGPCFMAGSGLLAVWSYRVFPDRPTPGFTATVLALGLGTITGPALLGRLADHQGLPAAFAATAVAAALTSLTPPRRAPRLAENTPLGISVTVKERYPGG
ncbi:YbfB/YjiJ family MFS transporter, partial [Streptomyces sp. NPDC059037]|uniref:YbfB/YjiJ family MFS transporter n=1 Tax=Streptomyces sp. NPDC059037 TaxID=3346710 RepID=UPI0036B6151A